MKQFTLAFSAFTFLCPAVFAQDVSSGKILITCPSEKNIKAAGSADQTGVSSVQYTPSFLFELPDRSTLEYKSEAASIKDFSDSSEAKVNFSLHSARFDDETLICAVRRDEGEKTQFLDFSISLVEINSFLAPKGYQVHSCEDISSGISCKPIKRAGLQ